MRRAAIVLLFLRTLGACATEPRAPDGRYVRGGISLFVEPRGASAMVFAGAISPLAYDYDAMASAGTLGCMKDDRGPSLSHGARLIDAGLVTVETPRAPALTVGFDRDTGAHVASSASPLFAAGDAVSVRGAGSAEVPPFAATASAPEAIAVDARLEPDGAVALTWPPAEGFVDVVVKSSARSWACVFRADRGSAVIARTLLEDEPRDVVLRTAAIHTTSTDAGGWHVSLTVASPRTDRSITLR